MSGAGAFSSRAWRETVECLIVGSARRPLPAVPDGADWAAALPTKAEAEADAAVQLADRAAVLGAHELAGREPRRLDPDGIQAFEGDERPVPIAAAGVLRELLAERKAGLFEEWVSLAAASDMHCPRELLPRYLSLWKQRGSSGLRDHLRAVAGPRGRWLADRDEQWAGLFGQTARSDDVGRITELFETGTTEERLAALGQLRRLDPHAARARLEQDFGRDRAEERALFVGALADDLVSEDEAFLESCLGDRSKRVKDRAASLLALLPSSALASRMRERLEGMVRIERQGLMRRPTIELQLPDALDDAMKRDGLVMEKRRTLGPKAAVVADLVAATPLTWWCEHFGLDPAALVKAARAGEWTLALFDGWQRRMAREPDAAWIRALLEDGLEHTGRNAEVQVGEALSLVDRLSDDDANPLRLLALGSNREGLALRGLTAGATGEWQHAERTAGHWDLAISRAALEAIRRWHGRLGPKEIMSHHLRAQLDHGLSRCLHPDVADEVLAGFKPALSPDHPLVPSLEKLIARLRFRQRMRAAFRVVAGDAS